MPKKFFHFVLWKMSKREGLSDLFLSTIFGNESVYVFCSMQYAAGAYCGSLIFSFIFGATKYKMYICGQI